MKIVTKDYLVPGGAQVRLSKWPTRVEPVYDTKKSYEKLLKKHVARLSDLQELLYASNRYSLLLVFQGMDSSGKDGVIKHVMSGVDPQGCRVSSFKAPNDEEKSHDFLWRIHKAVPPKGFIGIFNRSHYEDVLVVRVKGLVPEERWRRRYDHIVAFERLLADEGTTVVKFYLHISKEEQRQRLEARLQEPDKRWKFNPGDLEDRKLWDDFQEAYEEAITRTSTEHAPWYVIPADRKWYRDLAVASVLIETLERMDPRFPPEPDLDGVVIE